MLPVRAREVVAALALRASCRQPMRKLQGQTDSDKDWLRQGRCVLIGEKPMCDWRIVVSFAAAPLAEVVEYEADDPTPVSHP